MSKILESWNEVYEAIRNLRVEAYIHGLIEKTYDIYDVNPDDSIRLEARIRTSTFIYDLVDDLNYFSIAFDKEFNSKEIRLVK